MASWRVTLWILPLLMSGCGSSSSLPTNNSLPNTAGPYLNASGPNVLALKVGGGTVCGQAGYENELCTSVTVCMPGTTRCQTVSDILVDTGSVGLRVFPSVLDFSPPQQTDGSGNTLAECAEFGIGSDWGPLATADVTLGGETANGIPIQLIDKSFATVPSGCAQADTDPRQAGFNGILGIGSFNEDCGPLCAQTTSAGLYFSCKGMTCASVVMPLSMQLQNPVSHFPVDNNGVVLALPSIGPGGAAQVDGVMVLGIGTEPNNSPTGVSPYFTDPAGNFTTELNGKAYPGSFIDSGSNGIFFPNDVGLATCPSAGPAAGFYCPAGPVDLSATNASEAGNALVNVPFQIANAESLLSQPSSAYNNIGGEVSGGFDWGLPFFFGRVVFSGIEGRGSSLGTGPYWAY